MRRSAAATVLLAAGALAAAGLPAASAAPSGAQFEQYSVSGKAALADWYSEEAPAPGEVGSVTVRGVAAEQRVKAGPGKPTIEPIASGISLWLGTPPTEPGGAPGGAEVSCDAPDATFSIDDTLMQAHLTFQCDAAVLSFDPETGEPIGGGQSIPLSVTADWTGYGQTSKEQNRYRASDGSSWFMDRNHSSFRMAQAQISVLGPDGVLFDDAAMWAQLVEVNGGTITRNRGPLLMASAPYAAALQQRFHEQVTVRGTAAQALWWSEQEQPVGAPQIIYVMGADLAMVNRPGGQTEPVQQPSLLAMALFLPPTEPGGDPIPGEIWCEAPGAAFTADQQLRQADVRFNCDGVVYVVDADGNEQPTGEIVPLSVTASWTGEGALTRESSRNKITTVGQWTLERQSTTSRSAIAEVTISTGHGTLFDGTMADASIFKTAGARLYHADQSPQE